MKKLLIATTALVATAGAAAADISISGDGRMGFVYDGEDTKLSSRLRINFSASGETDNGLAFGGSTRADNSIASAAGFGGSVFISGAFGKLSMGDVDGAAKAAVGQVSGIGYTGMGDPNELVFLNSGSDVDGDATDGATIYPVPSALYEYTINATTIYAGIGQIGGDYVGDTYTSVGQSYSIGVKYANNGLVLSGGYESTADLVEEGSNASNWAFGADYTWSAFTIKGRYMNGDYGLIGDVQQYAISGDWASGATTVTAFYSMIDPKDVDGDRSSYGLGAAYDLGGGASVAGGVANVNGLDGDSTTIGDFGLKFNF